MKKFLFLTLIAIISIAISAFTSSAQLVFAHHTDGITSASAIKLPVLVIVAPSLPAIDTGQAVQAQTSTANYSYLTTTSVNTGQILISKDLRDELRSPDTIIAGLRSYASEYYCTIKRTGSQSIAK